MDRARAHRAIEAINLAATGDNSALQVMMDEARTELDNAGWNETMMPAAGLTSIGVLKPIVAPAEAAAAEPQQPATPSWLAQPVPPPEEYIDDDDDDDDDEDWVEDKAAPKLKTKPGKKK